MKYFLDTEFIEGPQTKRLLGMPVGKTKPTIDLISIGIVSEDDREYYAISKDFNLREAWDRFQMVEDNSFTSTRGSVKKVDYWIRNNVLMSIFIDLVKTHNKGDILKPIGEFSMSNLKWLLEKYGKSNTEIAEEVKDFVNLNAKYFEDKLNKGESVINIIKKPEFYAYYADYDWVAFCWLFGGMIDLPEGFPMYCRDLKQMLDDRLTHKSKMGVILDNSPGDACMIVELRHKDTLKERLNWIKNYARNPSYPKQDDEHNALADARWNKKLFNFLEKL